MYRQIGQYRPIGATILMQQSSETDLFADNDNPCFTVTYRIHRTIATNRKINSERYKKPKSMSS